MECKIIYFHGKFKRKGEFVCGFNMEINYLLRDKMKGKS